VHSRHVAFRIQDDHGIWNEFKAGGAVVKPGHMFIFRLTSDY
jgi:hypothetical protein